jgi:phage terminase large subunit-like protein
MKTPWMAKSQHRAAKAKVTADYLRKESPGYLRKYLSQLSKKHLEELIHDWSFWARPEQMEPTHLRPSHWDTWLALAGRGWGKTRAGAEWVRHRIKSGDKIVHCVAPTKGDVRKVMVEGDSGLLKVCWEGDKTYKGIELGLPVWSPTNSTLTWANGAKAVFFSAEDPERLRGPQCHSAWCDEVCAWRNAQSTWDMLQFGLRLGTSPKVFITTTPKPTKLLRTIVDHTRTVITTGSTYDNQDNLAKVFITNIRDQYEGTRLGRQELYAEVLDEASGALWTREILEACEVDKKDVPELKRIIISIDPATTANEESDDTGIIVAGVDVNGHAYVLEDYTDKYSPSEWAAKAVSLYYEHEADRVVAEKNQGGEMVRHTLQTADETLPITLVHASRGKFARAEPVSALYEQGKVKHVKGLNDLEDQMVQWDPLGSIGSPDRLDATVWAITDLILKGRALPTLNMITGKPE